ncbi:hypothetical protein HDU76_003094, partial [Blyttiomyces sp. JEL0837]
APSDGSSSVRALSVYLIAAGVALASLQLRYVIQIFFTLRASSKLHSGALGGLFAAPLFWIEGTPTGRVTNRFGKDMQVVDQEVVSSIGETVQQCVHGLVVVAMMLTASPFLILAAVPIAFIYMPIARRFMSVTRSLKRLEASARSPVYSAFGETLAGVVTIRAFRKESYFVDMLYKKIDENHKAFLLLWATNRWLAVRVEVVGTLVAFAVGVSIALSRDQEGIGRIFGGWALDAGWSGICLTYAGMFTDVLTWIVRNSATLEMTMTSVERVHEYSALTKEGGNTPVTVHPPAEWPSRGEIVIKNLEVRYSPELPPAVNIPSEFVIRPGERIAIVGRTGSGKTTLGLALARVVDFSRGTVLVDGIDISKVSLEDLRRSVTVVPQDVFLFKGSLRVNLDPLEEYDDFELNKALQLLRFTSSAQSENTSSPLSLDTFISDNGSNFSVGQRQLISIGRALVRKLAIPKNSRTPRCGVLVLDEATASLDSRSDKVAQEAFRSLLLDDGAGGKATSRHSVTSIVIAHRLKTIMDANKVCVMSGGTIVQHGTPLELLNRAGPFYDLCLESGEFDELSSLAESASQDKV